MDHDGAQPSENMLSRGEAEFGACVHAAIRAC